MRNTTSLALKIQNLSTTRWTGAPLQTGDSEARITLLQIRRLIDIPLNQVEAEVHFSFWLFQFNLALKPQPPLSPQIQKQKAKLKSK